MKNTNILFLGATLLSFGVIACGDDSGTGGAGGTSGSSNAASTGGTPTSSSSSASGSPTSTSTGENTGGEGGGTGGDPGVGGAGGEGGEGGSGPPAVPELGPQVERMGRPAVNTALNETFITVNGGLGPTTDEIRHASEDAYNAAVNGSDEANAFAVTMALQLTVLDSLDDECGNQALYGFGHTPEECDPATSTLDAPSCYGTLATVLSNDALWVKTDYETCGIYLGVEADAANGLGALDLPQNADCGGRRPVDDVIRTTYSVVSGAYDIAEEGIFLFDDGIDAPADLHPTDFPYLAEPH